MMGKADSDGKVEGIFVRKLHPNLSFKLNAGFQSSNVEQGVINTELQLENKHSTGSFKLGQGHWGFGFNQRVHPNLIVGFDYLNLVEILLYSDSSKALTLELWLESLYQKSQFICKLSCHPTAI